MVYKMESFKNYDEKRPGKENVHIEKKSSCQSCPKMLNADQSKAF